MKNFCSTGLLVTHGFIDSTVGAMTKKLILVYLEGFVSKDVLLTLKSLASHVSYIIGFYCVLELNKELNEF